MMMVSPNNTDHNGPITSDMDAWDHVDDVVEEISEDYLESVGSHPSLHRINSLSTTSSSLSLPTLDRVVRSLNDHYITHGECRRTNVIGELVTDASQFLFPCTIEYSLICAAILYIMWKNISEMFVSTPVSFRGFLIYSALSLHRGNRRNKNVSRNNRIQISKTQTSLTHQRHHYQVTYWPSDFPPSNSTNLGGLRQSPQRPIHRNFPNGHVHHIVDTVFCLY